MLLGAIFYCKNLLPMYVCQYSTLDRSIKIPKETEKGKYKPQQQWLMCKKDIDIYKRCEDIPKNALTSAKDRLKLKFFLAFSVDYPLPSELVG